MNKKLTKNSQDKKLFGVCSGVAEYFNIDPTLVRLGFALSVALLGTGLGVYLVMALVLPEKTA